MRCALLIAAVMVLSVGAARAQGCGPTNPNCIVPTAPAGTNNNQAASTAFVQTAVGGGGMGTAGYALIGNGASPATFQGFTETGTGAVAQTWQSKASETINIRDFGAKCDGSTDDTVAIQAAITQAEAIHGTVLIPASGTKGCVVSDAGGAPVLSVVGGINIVGQGWSTNGSLNGGGAIQGSFLLIKSSTATTSTIISVTPPSVNGEADGFYFANFAIVGNGTAGGDAIRLDTNSVCCGLAMIEFDHLNLGATSGYSINMDSPDSTTGTYLAHFHNSYMAGASGGILCDYCGDSIFVDHNWIHTAGFGVGIVQVPGAGSFTVAHNNISAAAGAVVVDQAVACRIGPGNEFEQQANSTEPNGAIVDLRGIISTIDSCNIEGNEIQDTSSFHALPINIANAANTYIAGNRLARAQATDVIVLGASAVGTVIGGGNSFASPGSCGGNTGVNCVDNAGIDSVYTLDYNH
jgi:hypothetical protein